MTQSHSADAGPSGALAAQRTGGLVMALRNWRVARQLIVLVAIPAVLILILTGLRVTDTARSAEAYGQVGRLAALGQQVTVLAQAMADERSGAAAFIAAGRPAAGLPALRRQYALTDVRAARVRLLVSQLGQGYPAQTQAGAAEVLASIAKLPGLRTQAVHSRASALAVITGYTAATAGVFPVNDSIADLSGSPALITSVQALGSLSGMIDHASQQQAILGVALAEGRFAPGALTALTIAQTQQARDIASFRNSATTEESRALTVTLARPLARQAQAVQQRATAAGDGALALGPQASQQWLAGMSYTIGWMRQAEQQLAGWITADARAQQRNAMQSAIITGGAGLGALALVLLGTIFAARSMVRRLRRLEAAAREGAGAPPAVSAGPLYDAALISVDAEPGGWRRQAGEAFLTGASEEAGPGVANVPFSARRFASGPAPAIGPEADTREPVKVMLGAPVPTPAPGTAAGVTEPAPVGAEPGDGPPIFESVRSGYALAFGRDLLRFSEELAGQPSAGRPVRPPASWGDGSGRAAARLPAAGHPASSGQPGQDG